MIYNVTQCHIVSLRIASCHMVNVTWSKWLRHALCQWKVSLPSKKAFE